MKKYYMAFGRTIAMRDASGVVQGAPAFMLQDHLGSSVGVLDSTGALIANSKTAYWPFGATRSGGSTSTDKMYTGQQQETGDFTLGVYNYKARFYSTTLGRFMSADSIVPNKGAPQALNRYAYADGNPVRFTDPSGHCVKDSAGRWMPCSKDIQVQYFSCAWGGACDSRGADINLVRLYAQGVLDTDAFKYFVAVTDPYEVHLRYSGKIHDVARLIFRPITTGTVEFDVGIDPVRRTIVSVGSSFTPGKGITFPTVSCSFLIGCIPGWTQVFDGWKQGSTSRVFSTSRADFHMEAGPEEGNNPFKFTGLYAAIDWTVIMSAGHPLFEYPTLTVRQENGLPSGETLLVLRDAELTVDAAP